MYSILVSSHDRLALLRRTLHSIVRNPPPGPHEVVLADDGSTEDVLGLLRNFSGSFPWTFIRVDREVFAAHTGVRPYFNCPAWTNNVAARHARGEAFFLQGNEVMVGPDCYRRMVEQHAPDRLVFSTTLNVPLDVLVRLPEDGYPTAAQLEECWKWPLHSEHYRSDVTNYCSLVSRQAWLDMGGYDERYVGGISGEDSDFVRRFRLRGSTVIVEGLSLHQDHGGKTRYQQPRPSVISLARFREGCAINRLLYEDWQGQYASQQWWEWGAVGVQEVIRS